MHLTPFMHNINIIFLLFYFIYLIKNIEKSKEHIRHCLLYEFPSGHSATEAIRNKFTAIGPDAISPMTATRWFQRFRNNNY